MASPEILDGSAPVPTVPPCAAPQIPRGDTLVTIFAGPEEVKYVVHKAPLVAASKFFDTAFDGGFAESVTTELKLPEDDADIIGFLCEWLYTKPVLEQKWAPTHLRCSWQPDKFWLEVYITADKLLISGLQILAFDEITRIFNSVESTIPSETFIDTLYQHYESVVLQTYVAEHVTYWMPKSAKKRKWLHILRQNVRLAAIVGTEIADNTPEHPLFAHPSADAAFAENHGLHIRELQMAARRADTMGAQMQALDCARIDETCASACYGLYVPGNPPAIVDRTTSKTANASKANASSRKRPRRSRY